jgi:RNA polymerase sigma-70 factor (ECF subfamily)
MDYSRIPDNKNSEDVLAKETLRKALDKIPFDFRSTLILKEIEGLSYEEIAQTLKIRLGTVESRIFRARRMLKNLLTRKEAR